MVTISGFDNARSAGPSKVFIARVISQHYGAYVISTPHLGTEVGLDCLHVGGLES